MKRPSRVLLRNSLIFLSCCLAWPLGTTFAQKKVESSVTGALPDFNAPSSDFAGPELCRECHKDESVRNDKTRHWQMVFPGKDYIQGCETCHGPAKAHAASVQAAHGDDAATAQALAQHPVFNFKDHSTKEINERCLTCHAGGTQQMNAINSEHSKNGVSCVSCHSPHHGSDSNFLLTKSQPELCYSCHLGQKPQFDMPFHHRVNEGLIQCNDCHNVHGTVKPKQVRTSSTQDFVCFKCHTDKQGPYVFEHEAVKIEGCQSCHVTHGGPNPHMLKVSNLNLLCLQCHTQSSFSGAPGTPSFHNQNTFFQACTLCHSQIHGSNFDQFFFK